MALLVALPVLRNGFVMEENNVVLVGNQAIRSLASIPRFFAGPWVGGFNNLGYYRPLAGTLYTLEYALFGLHSVGWHLVSVLLYAATSALTALVCARIARSPVAAAVGGLLFAVLPVHVEAFAMVGYQTTLLAGLLSAAALLAFGRVLKEGPTPRTLLLLGLACTGALLSKEEAFAMPLLALAWALVERPPGWRRAVVAALAVLVPCAGAVLLLRALTLAPIAVTFFGDAPRATVIRTMLRTVPLDLELLLVPLRLCPFYDWFIVPFEDHLSAQVAFGLAIVVALAVAIAATVKRAPPVAIGLLWLPIGLLPVLQLVPFIVVAADRFLFIPSFGLALAAGALAVRARPGRIALVLMGLVLALYATRSALRIPDWHDDRTLNEATAAAFPETPTPLLNLAQYYEARGELAAARQSLDEAARRAPGWDVPRNRLAKLKP